MLDELVKFEGCDLNAKNAQELTPLHIAVQHGHGKSIEKLLSLGCNPNVVVISAINLIIQVV